MPRIVKSCQCNKCNCPNKIKEFGHRYEEENAIVKAEFEHDVEPFITDYIREVLEESREFNKDYEEKLFKELAKKSGFNPREKYHQRAGNNV